jgi:hypothetical protein
MAKRIYCCQNENGEIALYFTEDLPDYLKDSKDWTIFYTDNPHQNLKDWEQVDSDGRPLDRISIPQMNAGTLYYVIVDKEKEGIMTPIFSVMTPKPPSEIRVGPNINEELVVDFKPAISSDEIKGYTVKYWPSNDPMSISYIDVPPENTTGIVIHGLEPDMDYTFQVTAKFVEGDTLSSDQIVAKSPKGDIVCDCSHECKFTPDESGVPKPICYCPEGMELSDDEKTCIEKIQDAGEQAIIQFLQHSNPANHTRTRCWTLKQLTNLHLK